jgi:transcriptional regulator with XRE-family HTH domain
VPHDRALLPRTKVFVADAIDCRVSARLAARRRELGIDRGLLDLLLDVRDGTVERLETGRSRIAPSRLFQLARILDVPIDWFFDEAQSETPPAEPVSAGRGAERQAEARRFLALYVRIADPNVRAEIREMVRSLAAASSRPVVPASGLASAFVRTAQQRRSA